MPQDDLYLRRIGLQVTPSIGDQGIDLSDMHIVFSVTAADTETPTTARIRVFNLSSDIAQKIQKEFSGVILSAGYQHGNYGVIFKGVLKIVGRGKASNVDTYLDLFASDENWYAWAKVNKTLDIGYTQDQYVDSIIKPSDPKDGVNLGFHPTWENTVVPNLRGKVLFGMARSYARYVGINYNTDVSVQNGSLQFVPKDKYTDKEVVVLNSGTGMIGQPEQTNQGINIRCLLNPKILVGQRIQINNKDINQQTVKQQAFPKYTDIIYLAPTDPSNDGTYRAFVVEHQGDTRDNPWYTDLVCLRVDPTSGKVELYGG